MIRNNPLYFTLSDANFAPRTLAMLTSIRKYDTNADLLFVVVGKLPERFFQAFEKINVQVRFLPELLDSSVLKQIQESRSYISTLWTYPSIILNTLIQSNCDHSDIVYLDADLFFFEDPGWCWGEVPTGNISIVRHNFSDRLAKEFPESGEFNVSWVSMPSNDVGRQCAKLWAEECYALCPDVPVEHEGRTIYGDQRYLDRWPELFGESLTVFQNPGIGLAPWNYENYLIEYGGSWEVDSQKLVFYHFSSHQFGFFLARRMGRTYSEVSKVPKKLYRDYEQELSLAARNLGLVSWKSRYEPLCKRLVNYFKRGFRLWE
jgi:hypothetical protein